MELIYFIFITYGLTQILVYGKIFDKIRPKFEFFKCPMCIGFWVGGLIFLINGYTELFSFEYNLINFFLLSCLSSGTSYVLCALFGDKGININYKN